MLSTVLFLAVALGPVYWSGSVDDASSLATAAALIAILASVGATILAMRFVHFRPPMSHGRRPATRRARSAGVAKGAQVLSHLFGDAFAARTGGEPRRQCEEAGEGARVA